MVGVRKAVIFCEIIDEMYADSFVGVQDIANTKQQYLHLR
jgi:hypothetical protein